MKYINLVEKSCLISAENFSEIDTFGDSYNFCFKYLIFPSFLAISRYGFGYSIKYSKMNIFNFIDESKIEVINIPGVSLYMYKNEIVYIKDHRYMISNSMFFLYNDIKNIEKIQSLYRSMAKVLADRSEIGYKISNIKNSEYMDENFKNVLLKDMSSIEEGFAISEEKISKDLDIIFKEKIIIECKEMV